MTIERIEQIAVAMGTDESQIKAYALMTPEEVVAAFAAKGFDCTTDELNEFAEYVAKQAASKEELNENDLASVAGGSIVAAAFVVGVIGGMMLNKMTKSGTIW